MSILHKENDEMVIDIVALLKLLWKKIIIILVCAAIAGGGAYALSKNFLPEQYRANVTMYVNNKGNAEGTSTLTTSDLSASVHLVDTYSVIIKNRSVVHEIAKMVEMEEFEKEITSMISIAPLNNTEVFEVNVTYTDPAVATRIADAIALVAPNRISEIVEGSSVKVVSYAEEPETSIGPSYIKFALLGAVAGALLAAAVVVIRAMMDTTVKSESDFAQWKYPLLTSIPDLNEARRAKNGYGYGYGYGYGAQKKRN